MMIVIFSGWVFCMRKIPLVNGCTWILTIVGSIPPLVKSVLVLYNFCLKSSATNFVAFDGCRRWVTGGFVGRRWWGRWCFGSRWWGDGAGGHRFKVFIVLFGVHCSVWCSSPVVPAEAEVTFLSLMMPK
ncbi:hypothetical protein Hdeb2414_s0012g00391901 [Helianthus debilis subsp. tardiflorus]